LLVQAAGGNSNGFTMTGNGSGKDINAAEIDSIKSTVDTNLDTTVSSRGTADPGDEMNLANDAITSAKYDETTAFPVASADSGSTEIARTGADGDTLETLSDEIAAVQSDVTGIKANTDNLPSGVEKNTALNNFEFLMVDSTDHVSPKTGLTVTSQRSIDGAAFSSCANSATELSNGVYKIDLAASDLNGTVITLRFSGSGADDRFITLKTDD
jgi:hypothetical protein